MVIVGCQCQVKIPDQQVVFLVLHRRHERIAVAELLAEHRFLIHTRLYFLVEVGISQTEHQAVGPGLSREAQLCDDSFIVELVVETFHPILLSVLRREIDASVFHDLETAYLVVDVIIVVRKVLECIDFVSEAVGECLAEIHVRLVRVEGSVRVGCIQEPVALTLVGHDVDYSPDGIRTESYGDDSFIDLNPFRIVDRNVIDVESRSGSFLRYAVDEHLHMVSAESVQHQLHVGADASRFTQLHARELLKGFSQILGRVLKFLCIDSHRIECRLLDPADSAGHHFHFFQFRERRLQHDVLPGASVRSNPDFFFNGLKTYGRHDQCIGSRRSFQMINTLFVGHTPVLGSFQVNCCKVDNGVVGRQDFPGKQRSLTLCKDRKLAYCQTKQGQDAVCNFCFQCNLVSIC